MVTPMRTKGKHTSLYLLAAVKSFWNSIVRVGSTAKLGSFMAPLSA